MDVCPLFRSLKQIVATASTYPGWDIASRCWAISRFDCPVPIICCGVSTGQPEHLIQTQDFRHDSRISVEQEPQNRMILLFLGRPRRLHLGAWASRAEEITGDVQQTWTSRKPSRWDS